MVNFSQSGQMPPRCGTTSPVVNVRTFGWSNSGRKEPGPWKSLSFEAASGRLAFFFLVLPPLLFFFFSSRGVLFFVQDRGGMVGPDARPKGEAPEAGQLGRKWPSSQFSGCWVCRFFVAPRRRKFGGPVNFDASSRKPTSRRSFPQNKTDP